MGGGGGEVNVFTMIETHRVACAFYLRENIHSPCHGRNTLFTRGRLCKGGKMPHLIYIWFYFLFILDKCFYYLTMTPLYQIRSREHEKSESGLHGKSRIFPRLYRFFWYRRSKNPTFCSQNEKCKT